MKTVLITGASSGIGKATAYYFAKNGFRLILCARRKNNLQELEKELSSLTTVTTLCFDVSNKNAVKEAISSLSDDWKQIDVLINNAGNAHGLDSILDADISDWDQMMDSNVKGLLYVSKEVIPRMKLHGVGHIINISSVAARQTYSGGVVYCASKRAVDVISEGMRLELTEFGIKVTNIQPGAVETEFSLVRFKGNTERASQVYKGYTPLLADDIADAILYCVQAPQHVTISDMTIYPSAQSEPRTIHRKL